MRVNIPTTSLPKVSVCVITYNHERFLRECLVSIFSQEVDFVFEVIIADDLSTDGTRAIAREFAAKYAGQVRLILPDTKPGPVATFVSLHDAASGEYIAHIDGDDAMLPGRLQAQTAFLDSHPECVMVGHDVRVVSRTDGAVISPSFIGRPIPEVTDLEFLLTNGCFFAHSSKMYRRTANASWDRNEPVVDFYLHVAHVLQGKMGYIDQVLGVYRRGAGSISDVGSSYFRTVVDGHLHAYRFALQHGVPAEFIGRLIANYKYVNAMHCLRSDRLDLFRELIALDHDERPNASARHRLMARMAPLGSLALGMVWLFDLPARLRIGVSK